MKHILTLLLLLCSVSTHAQRARTQEAQEATRNHIIKKAPIVFLGRPIQSEFFLGQDGLVYLSTLIQVLEVLRGEPHMNADTVEYVNSFTTQTPEQKAAAQRHDTSPHSYSYGIYFSMPSALPSKQSPQFVAKRPLQLMPFENIYEAKLEVVAAKGGASIGGLYKGWESPEAMIQYINSLPNLKRLTRPIDSDSYPGIDFKRTAPERTAGLSASKPEQPGITPTIISKEEIEYLPQVMKRMRNGERLSRKDSVFIKKYLNKSLVPTRK